MGMYTALKAKIKIAPAFLPGIVHVCDHGGYWDTSGLPELLPSAKGFWEDSRRMFIPKGAPADWKMDGDVFSFECSLKNYNSTIQHFMDEVVAKISSYAMLCTQYCEDNFWRLYVKVPGLEKVPCIGVSNWINPELERHPFDALAGTDPSPPADILSPMDRINLRELLLRPGVEPWSFPRAVVIEDVENKLIDLGIHKAIA